MTFEDFAERSLLLSGRVAARQLPRHTQITDLSEVEFRVFSQWGEDGIVDWLVSQVALPNHRFIEFGVETFAEANCRFLLQNRNWTGLVLDGSEANIQRLRATNLFWMFDLTAQAAFVTAENIDDIITHANFAGDIGILSIDVDGNDYWIWRAIASVNPAIVICEYNPVFGDRWPVAVPYDPTFRRLERHHSGLYFGASIAALQHLAAQKGYVLVGSCSNGINAFFVRADLAGPVLALLANRRSFPSKHRDSRDQNGRLTHTGGLGRLTLVADMPVVNVETNRLGRLGDLNEPYSKEWLALMDCP
jgi:hypothetical protein